MAQWQKTQIQLDSGMMAEAQAPVIISASRSTDILAFYVDLSVFTILFVAQKRNEYFCKHKLIHKVHGNNSTNLA